MANKQHLINIRRFTALLQFPAMQRNVVFAPFNPQSGGVFEAFVIPEKVGKAEEIVKVKVSFSSRYGALSSCEEYPEFNGLRRSRFAVTKVLVSEATRAKIMRKVRDIADKKMAASEYAKDPDDRNHEAIMYFLGLYLIEGQTVEFNGEKFTWVKTVSDKRYVTRAVWALASERTGMVTELRPKEAYDLSPANAKHYEKLLSKYRDEMTQFEEKCYQEAEREVGI